MNRDKLLWLTALLMACAGLLVMGQPVRAGDDDWLARAAQAGGVH
ncbi:MAG TPA: hypothetical protein VFZ28_14115 [Burkholderiaceae bacterium]|nr:hypothetical protein [Burkholderiaceae bacterium]